VVLKMRIKTVPLKQWEVGREFRKRIRQRFEAEGIDVPFPVASPPTPPQGPGVVPAEE
jgi:small-conductance mechanosensitive channel